MADILQEVVDDLEAEQAALESALLRMPADAWDRPTHAPGWMVRDQVAHLAVFDEQATIAIVDAGAFRESLKVRADPKYNFEAEYLARGRAMGHEQLLEWWRLESAALIAAGRAMAGEARLPWYGPDMSSVSFMTARLMETWSHGLDVIDVAGVDRPDTDRLRHVAFLGVRTRSFSYINRGLQPNTEPVLVELLAPSGVTWKFGEGGTENVIRGTATDFCRVVTQRRHLGDTALEVVGPAANEWMQLAQAFAGPPGRGRQPGEFAGEKAQK
jgi:uncharacterized protein (TIGR03084 family)